MTEAVADGDLRRVIQSQREELTALLSRRLLELGTTCAGLLSNRQVLETRLSNEIGQLKYCQQLFVLDENGQQTIDNITRDGPDPRHFGRDRSMRPYIRELAGSTDFRLSEAYISQNTRRPMITAVQVLRAPSGERLGYLGADYDLRDLPATSQLYLQHRDWRQIKGDPAIRGGLFSQQRSQSVMDDHIDDVLSLMLEMMSEHGVFHGKLHFSSSRATVWLLDEPCIYRIWSIEELIDPSMCLAHPKRPYPEGAAVNRDEIKAVFELFRGLRFADDTVYLRSGSLNLFNSLVGLNFSCDGSHYVKTQEFMQRGIDFWMGAEK